MPSPRQKDDERASDPVISADWLMDGLRKVSMLDGPPTGLEFVGWVFPAGADPVVAIAQLGNNSLDTDAALRSAVRDGITTSSLSGNHRRIREAILNLLVRLVDYYATPAAVLALLTRLERAEFVGCRSELAERLAVLGSRQGGELRERFETGLRRHGHWNAVMAAPFLLSTLHDRPRSWPSIVRKYACDIEEGRAVGIDYLSDAFRRISEIGLLRELFQGLGAGADPENKFAVELVFRGPDPDIFLAVIPGEWDVLTSYTVIMSVDGNSCSDKLGNMFPARALTLDNESESERVVSMVDDWARFIVETARINERA